MIVLWTAQLEPTSRSRVSADVQHCASGEVEHGPSMVSHVSHLLTFDCGQNKDTVSQKKHPRDPPEEKQLLSKTAFQQKKTPCNLLGQRIPFTEDNPLAVRASAEIFGRKTCAYDEGQMGKLWAAPSKAAN